MHPDDPTSAEIEVRVLFFARAKDLTGEPGAPLRLRRGATVAEARQAIAETWPALSELLGQCRLALDFELAPPETVIRPGGELAVLPPVSGG